MSNNIVICIPTCGGPYLQKCIESLLRSSKKNFDIIVVFNGSSFLVSDCVLSEYSILNIKYFKIHEQGVVHVRNFFIDYAFIKNNYDYLVMLDDDQIVEFNWFENISTMCANDENDIIGSYVKPYFLNSAQEEWMSKLNVYYLNDRDTGSVNLIHGTGGTVFKRSILNIMGNQMFDPLFALTGGEDADFFIRAKLGGAKFYRANEAICYEIIDEKRADFKWAKDRYYRIGFCDSKLNAKYKKVSFYYLIAFISVIVYFIFSLIHFDDLKRKKYACLVSRQMGKLAFLFGKNKIFYKKRG